MRNFLFIFTLFLGYFFYSQANDETFINKLRCGTDQLHREVLNNDSSIRQARDYFENVIMPIAMQNAANRPVNVIYQVPVVVHIIQKGEEVGVGSNISDADVKLGKKYLNNFWRKIAGTFGAGGGVDMQIEFALAVRDPNGWTAGYAYFESSHGNATDGAVMLNCSYLDASDVTFAHEMGHAFNLYQTFEGDNNGTSFPTTANGCGTGSGDCCADIPAHSMNTQKITKHE